MEEKLILEQEETPSCDSEKVQKKKIPPAVASLLGWLEEKREGPWPLVLSFLLPFLIFSLCLVFQGVYPFGTGQIINYDGWHQYYPFLLQLWDHFKEGSSLLYDWSMGMGTNFLSMLSYYGSSPLNLLLILAPAREFRLLFTLFVALRIGLAGLFCALFLKKVFRSPGWSVAFFGLGYALCGYMMGYYWNNMWLDTVALYPLLCLGTVMLFREGKCSLYILALSLSLFSNYYIGFMSCVFTIIVFFSLCVLDRIRFSDFLRRGFRLLVTTLLGAGVSAVILLPAFFGLLNTASTREATPMYVSFYESVRDLVAPLASFHEPVVMDGLPNLATAAILILFAFSFLWAKKISLKEKLVAFFVVVFLVFSMNFSVLNYIWHGFHYTNMIPYRFAYLFAFVVVLMAYRYYRVAVEEFDWIDAVGMVIFSAVVAFCAYGLYPDLSILATVAVFAITLILVALVAGKFIPKRLFSFLVCLILLVEMTFSAWLGTTAVGVSDHEAYFDLETGEEVMALVEQVKEKEGDSFYRMETTEWRSLNDSCFYGYPGISQFSSAANLNVARFLQGLGMPADPGSNRFVYVHGTPLSNTLLGVKYLVSKTGYLSDTDLTCISPSSNEFTSALYECNGFSGLGFMIDAEGAGFQFDLSQKPYERQNALFSAITGLEGELFTPLYALEGEYKGAEVTELGGDQYEYTVPAPVEEEEAESPVLRFTYQSPARSMVYIYADVPGENYVQVNNAWHCIEDYPNLFSAGLFGEGEKFNLRVVLQEESSEEYSSRCSFDVVVLNEALWKEGLALIQDETLRLTRFEDTYLEGFVTAKEEGFLYTSIPWEMKESWTVRVDGEVVETYPFAGSFVGLVVPEGEHRIDFSYSPLGFEKGLVISLVSLLLWIGLWYGEKKGFRLFRDKPLPAVEPETEEAEQQEQEAGASGICDEKEGGPCDRTEIDEHHPQGS